jgi:hypothetical protein
VSDTFFFLAESPFGGKRSEMELEHSFDGFGSTHLLRIGLPDVSMKNNKKNKKHVGANGSV